MTLPIFSFWDSSFASNSLLCFSDDSHSCVEREEEKKTQNKIVFENEHKINELELGQCVDICFPLHSIFIWNLFFYFNFFFQSIQSI